MGKKVMVSNIVIVCLLDDIKKKVGLKLADMLDMFYADINDLVEFDVINSEDVENKMGTEYFEKLLNKQVQNVSQFENSVITADIKTLTKEKNVKALKESSIIVYLQVSAKKYMNFLKKKNKGEMAPIDVINSNMFFDRDKLSGKACDILINCKTNFSGLIAKKIVKELNKFYKGSK